MLKNAVVKRRGKATYWVSMGELGPREKWEIGNGELTTVIWVRVLRSSPCDTAVSVWLRLDTVCNWLN